jgi:hypothetical protein
MLPLMVPAVEIWNIFSTALIHCCWLAVPDVIASVCVGEGGVVCAFVHVSVCVVGSTQLGCGCGCVCSCDRCGLCFVGIAYCCWITLADVIASVCACVCVSVSVSVYGFNRGRGGCGEGCVKER